jgi:hypothetical protein
MDGWRESETSQSSETDTTQQSVTAARVQLYSNHLRISSVTRVAEERTCSYTSQGLRSAGLGVLPIKRNLSTCSAALSTIDVVRCSVLFRSVCSHHVHHDDTRTRWPWHRD